MSKPHITVINNESEQVSKTEIKLRISFHSGLFECSKSVVMSGTTY